MPSRNSDTYSLLILDEHLWKWIDANIKYVKGVDLSPGEIEEARGRYQQALAGKRQVGTVVEFEDSSILGIEEFREKEAA